MRGNVYTVGHGRTADARTLVDLARVHDCALVDVRSKPYSRRNPAANKERLLAEAQAQGVCYRWAGAILGGWSKAPRAEQEVLLRRLLGEHGNILLLCSETDPRRCHREYRLGRWLREAGVTVTHLRVGETTRCRGPGRQLELV